MDYRIVEKAPFTAVGIKKSFGTENSYREVPLFWQETFERGCPLKGMFGICFDTEPARFDYWIADLYQPWDEIPDGCETTVIPGGLWAEFTCKGPLPGSLQSVNTKIWSEWLPALKGYSLAGNYSVEMYTPPAEDPENDVNYIWIPLKKDSQEQ